MNDFWDCHVHRSPRLLIWFVGSIGLLLYRSNINHYSKPFVLEQWAAKARHKMEIFECDACTWLMLDLHLQPAQWEGPSTHSLHMGWVPQKNVGHGYQPIHLAYYAAYPIYYVLTVDHCCIGKIYKQRTPKGMIVFIHIQRTCSCIINKPVISLPWRREQCVLGPTPP